MVRPKERRGEEEADVLVMWLGTAPSTAEGPGATLRRSFSAFRRSTSSWGTTRQGKELYSSSTLGCSMVVRMQGLWAPRY